MAAPGRLLGARRAILAAALAALAATLHGCGGDSGSNNNAWGVNDNGTLVNQTTLTTTPSAFSNDQVAQLLRDLLEAKTTVASLQEQIAGMQTGGPRCRSTSCSDECADLGMTGRWRFGPYGFDCADPVTGKTYCHCSHATDEATACAEVQDVGTQRRLRAGRQAQRQASLEGRALQEVRAIVAPWSPPHAAAAAAAHPAVAAAHAESHSEGITVQREITQLVEAAWSLGFSPSPPPPPDAAAVAAADDVAALYRGDLAALARRLGTPTETVENFCNASAMAYMSGFDTSDTDASSHLESSIVSDVAHELEDNNVDKMAREIFTFYVCVRWVPDDTFWQLARQEMAANLVSSVVGDSTDINQAIAQLYQNYKFVPMLCSENMQVFAETDAEDNTYFRKFKKEVGSLVKWLSNHSNDKVAQKLTEVDSIFCGNSNMNDPSCQRDQQVSDWLSSVTGFLGKWGWNKPTATDKWQAVADIFQQFQNETNSTWKRALADWRARFPFHSFVSKNDGMEPSDSPESGQRFLVCFGQRVASELHRRPAGQHILTDQNNIGCHGFWGTQEAIGMLQRMIEMWKPPTCQLAQMTYVMKKEILNMFSQMNTKLFDALPTMIMDEKLASEGLLNSSVAGPPPYNPKQLNINGALFIDGLRVRSMVAITDPADCVDDTIWNYFSSKPKCRFKASIGDYATVAITNSTLCVVFDGDKKQSPVSVAPGSIQLVPHGWVAGATAAQVAQNLVAGVAEVTDFAQGIFNNMFRTRYTSLASLMSNSTSKWVVCPIRSDANYTQLDAQLGVEDAAFKDFQKEAYATWTGYTAALPGEACATPDFFSIAGFPSGKVCEIAQLHADHLEKYTNDDGSLEQFLCPLKVSLPPPEQLTILTQKKGMCFLHMTPEHQRHYQWPYNGDYPARRQFDRKPNMPNVEFELVQIQHVPSSGNVSFARACSPDELLGTPRFCKPTEFYRSWESVSQMAAALGNAAVGSLGMGAASIMQGISQYTTIFKQEGVNASDKARQSATLLGEQLWDDLTGAGRLVRSLASSAVHTISDGLPGGTQRDARIEAEMFGEAEAGRFLHTLSFQHSIGKDNATSNSKERYQRFVMTMPCPDFNPAVEFATKKTWSAIALNLVQSAVNIGKLSLFDAPAITFALRGEGRYFFRRQQQKANDTWWTYGASMTASGVVASGSDVSCAWSWKSVKCLPADQCVHTGLGFACVPKTTVSSSGWWRTDTQTLLQTVAPAVSLGNAPVTELYGITATMYCGPKNQFNLTGAGPYASPTFKDCLQAGMATNAKLRALYPWKLYWPDEVVVVVMFSALTDRYCKVVDTADVKSKPVICGSGATNSTDLDAQLSSSDKTSSDGVYQGIASGAGFPTGTPHEVVLRPEDVLEVAGMLSRS